MYIYIFFNKKNRAHKQTAKMANKKILQGGTNKKNKNKKEKRSPPVLMEVTGRLAIWGEGRHTKI